MESIKSKFFTKDNGNIVGIFSLTIPLVFFLLILNWFFKITSFQKLEGSPLLLAPIPGLIGLLLGYKSLQKSSNKFAKLGVIVILA
ncbi:MAG: hypothetical protein ACRKFN_11965 [Desulfitobacterium sp.]